MDHLIERLRQPAAGVFRELLDDLAQHGLRDDQFADHVDDAVDLFELDAGGGRGRLR